MCWKSGLSNTLLLLTIENANCYDDFQHAYPANIIVEFWLLFANCYRMLKSEVRIIN